MKYRNKPCSLQTYHDLFPPRPNQLHTHTHSPKRLAHPRSPMPPLSALTARATHALPLHTAALASVTNGVVFTPPEVTNTGPGFNRGSGGGPRGCGFEERVGAHAGIALTSSRNRAPL